MIIVLGIDYLVDNKSRAIIPLFSFFSGTLVFYHYFLENYFVSEKEFTQIFSYYMSMIYMLSGVFILIGYIMKQEERKNYFIIFILTNIILILILYFWVFRIKIINFRDESQYLSEYDIYLHSKNLLLSITNKTDNREYMINFLEYYSYNKNNIYKDLNSENDDYNLYLIVERTLKKRMIFFKNSVLLKLMHYMILKKYLKNHKSAYLLLYHLYLDIDNNLLSTTFSQKFFIYRLKKSIEDDSIEFNYNKNDISMRYQINTLIDLITRVSEKYYAFWNLLLSSTLNKEIKKINEMGNQIHKLIIEIDEKFNEIKNIKQKNSKVYLLYGYYLRDILNDKEKAEKYLNIDSSKMQENLGYKNKNDFISNSDFQFLILSMKKNSIIIDRISNEFCLNLGYSPNELIGKNINILFPSILKEEYEKELIKKLKKDLIYKNEKTIFYLKTKAKYLKVFPIEIIVNYDEEHKYFLLCKIIIEQYEHSLKKIKNLDCHIITDKNFLINLFSSSSIYLLELNSKCISSINISTLIKEINDEILKIKIEKNIKDKKLIIGFLRNLLKEKYINKENEIFWNITNFYFLLKCNEIIINGKLMGYYFYLNKIQEKTEKRMTIIKIHNNLSEQILPNVKIPTKTKTVKKSSKSLEPYERFIIDDSYIPKLDNEINFFPESKNYLFTGIDQSNNRNNIENYLKKNILNKALTKKSTKYTFKKKFKKVTFSDDSSNNSISSSNLSDDSENSDSDDVEISFEDYTSDDEYNDANNNLNNKSNIDVEEEKYYNVNLKKVLLFIYNFKKNSVVEIENFEKKSQIEIIFDYERKIKTKKKKNKNKKIKMFKFLFFNLVNNNFNKF